MKFNLSEITDRQIWGDMRFFGHELNYFLIQLLCTFLPFGIISMILQKLAPLPISKQFFVVTLFCHAFHIFFTLRKSLEIFGCSIIDNF